MAVTEAYTLNFHFEDAEHNQSIWSIDVGVDGDVLSIAELEAVATQYHDLVNAVCRGVIRKVTASIELHRYTPGSASDEADVEEKAQLILRADGTDKTKVMTIPTWSELHTNSLTGLIPFDEAGVTDVDNLFKAIINGVTENAKTVRVLDSEKRPLTSIKSSEEIFTATRRRR